MLFQNEITVKYFATVSNCLLSLALLVVVNFSNWSNRVNSIWAKCLLAVQIKHERVISFFPFFFFLLVSHYQATLNRCLTTILSPSTSGSSQTKQLLSLECSFYTLLCQSINCHPRWLIRKKYFGCGLGAAYLN